VQRRFASLELFQLRTILAERHTELVRIPGILEDRALELTIWRILHTDVRKVDERPDANVKLAEGAVWGEEVHTESTAADRAHPRRLRDVLVETGVLCIVRDIEF